MFQGLWKAVYLVVKGIEFRAGLPDVQIQPY